MKFTEEKLEKAFTELLGKEGFPHHLGVTISRKPEEVLIEEGQRVCLPLPEKIELKKILTLKKIKNTLPHRPKRQTKKDS